MRVVSVLRANSYAARYATAAIAVQGDSQRISRNILRAAGEGSGG